MKSHVYITIDVEASEERMVGGRFQPAMDYGLRVWGNLSNQPRPLGIEFIMSELEAYGFRGTFFVDPFGSNAFGFENLAQICRALHSRGHDVQLHAHPIQKDAFYLSGNRAPLRDDIGSYALTAQVDLLRDGLTRLRDCGIPGGSIVAFRAGNFGASNDTWTALDIANLPISSNFNPCYFPLNCKLRTRFSSSDLFAVPSHRVVELPMTCFLDTPIIPLPIPSALKPRWRHLQISAVSSAETITCLRNAQALGVEHLTVLTHSFEFLFIDSINERKGRPNAINIARFRELLQFLATNRDHFAVRTVADLAKENPNSGHLPPKGWPNGSRLERMSRFFEQGLKRLDATRKLPRGSSAQAIPISQSPKASP
jgi:hypothetical protein